MSLQTQLLEDMKNAMKSGDRTRLDAVRFLRSEIKNYEIDNGEQDDEGVLAIIARQVKQMNDSIQEYRKGDREDLAADEELKLAILKEYLPAQMSDDELRAIVKEVVTQSAGAQMGPVIGQVMARVKGQADGGRVSTMVREELA